MAFHGILRRSRSLLRHDVFSSISLGGTPPTSCLLRLSCAVPELRSSSQTSRSFSAVASEENHVFKELYNRQRQIMALDDDVPEVAVDAWVAPNAILIGNVSVEDRATVWYGAVLRGDLNRIRIGAYSNIGDNTVIHATTSTPTGLSAETNIGLYVTIGANCSLRSCMVENEVIIGHRCIVMEGSLIERFAILQPGSVVPPGRVVPCGQMWAGNPARYVRDVSEDEKAAFQKQAMMVHYQTEDHAEQFLPYSIAYLEKEKLLKALEPKAEVVAPEVVAPGVVAPEAKS